MSNTQRPLHAPENPLAPPAPEKGKNGFGVAALVLGIIAAVFAFIPVASYGAIAFGVAAVALGIVGLLKKNRPHGASIAGLIIGAIGLILAIVMTVFYAAVFFGISSAVHDQQKDAATSHTVVYSVTGSAKDADVTYSTFTDGNSGTQEAGDTALPFSKSVTVKGSSKSLAFNSFMVTAINGMDDTGSIACSITVDGKTVAHQTSSGAMASVTCSGSN